MKMNQGNDLRPLLRVFMGAGLLIGSGQIMAADDAATNTEAMQAIEVVGVTPTHGIGLPKDKIPTHIQSATNVDLQRSQSLDLSDFMNQNLGSVNINAAQNNPLQPDVQFRGFTASPLLGLPQGLAVYENGVRINEAFGDTVNWDLIPRSSISSINLIGGANPLYGLNTLGGALSVQTKNGFTDPGNSAEASYGSFGRLQSSISSGANNGSLGYFFTASHFEEDGWRDFSKSHALNLFGTVSWHTVDTTLDLNLAHGDTKLRGNGPSPVELLALDRQTGFTFVDITKNLMNMVDLEGTHWLNEDVQVSGNLFYRWNNTDSFNGDGTPYVGCSDVGLLFQEDDVDTTVGGDPAECDVAGDHAGATPITDQNGNTIAASQNAINNRSQRQQKSYGGSLQSTFLQDLFGQENQLIAGLAYIKGVTGFGSQVEAAALTANRFTTRPGVFVPADATHLGTSSRTWSLFFTDTHALTDTVNLTVSGRYNATKIKVFDKTGLTPELNGEHDYERFNPSVGLTWQARDNLNVYGSYSESARAPTAVELSCADANAPCTLPNAFLADPPLQQVVAESWEGGLRGKYADWADWNLSLFHTINVGDIIFQSTGGSTGNQGFFSNIGDTKRMGVELGLNGDYGHLHWTLNYSYVRATFDDAFLSSSPNNPKADANGLIRVSAGDRIPGIPEHTFKMGADYTFNDAFSLGANLVANSGQYLRGDEANLLDTTAAYAIVNLHGEYHVNHLLTLFAKVDNLFDTDYETFGILGAPGEVFDGSTPGQSPVMTDPRFLGPGAPIGGWVGVRLTF